MSLAAESLAAHFAALHDERVRTWEPAQLAKNIARREALVEAFDPAAVVRVGDRVGPFDLAASDGTRLSLDQLTRRGPLVLIFFRFAGCPACNLALPYYDRQLAPGVAAAGGTLVAVSPHRREKGLDEIRARHGLRFPVATDPDNALARRFGLTFDRGVVPDGQQAPGWIGELTGTGTAELPQPAAIVIGQDRTVRFVDVSPDWLDRTEAGPVLTALRGSDVRKAA